MPTTKTVICKYCGTGNSPGAKSCLACGAPIQAQRPAPVRVETVKSPTKSAVSSPMIEDQLKKVTEKADEAYFTLLNTYAIAWRTVGEAIAIAAAALIIGISGGAVGMGFWGVLGAIAVGMAVGLTQKNFYLALVSAPGGALIGLLVSSLFWVMGSPRIFPFIVSGFAVLGAVLGGKRNSGFVSKNWWEKLRPFFGALGGLAFGLLGMLLGLGIWGAIRLFQ